ncbi:L-threonylcarbamoyladenylate synthase [Asticcacaulis sp. SL142]|uniref:L-threonylcarbamoyladenylate synthase n=1 Tax=Asticcacaulis sp. SL142 TaxID=2995155 RepID=UPI00226D328B|nr:L-threonylcarbamoyladenylate synthase [Asticcacaulis sp. SL142]WAC48974.1 L-threonylcarbamoyladenylate synthase [Asticcacaulis sp. SL142]
MTSVSDAVAALNAGNLIFLPTETVYGLGASASDSVAVAKVFSAKGRPHFNPLIAHVADLAIAEGLAHFDDRACALAKAFWPGPLTLVVPYRNDGQVCDLARAGLDSVAIRMPAHPLALEILRAFGGGVVAPSANRSGRPSPTRFYDAVEETGAYVAAAIDGGDCQIGLESTVVSLMDGVRYLRAGAVTRQQIEAVIGPLEGDDHDGHRSPGRLTLHYAPEAKVEINVALPEPGCAYLAFGPTNYTGPVFQLSASSDLSEAASNLFKSLRDADKLKPSKICVAPVPDEGLGEAINDRLKRASGFIG